MNSEKSLTFNSCKGIALAAVRATKAECSPQKRRKPSLVKEIRVSSSLSINVQITEVWSSGERDICENQDGFRCTNGRFWH
jgi:hypothetical protein